MSNTERSTADPWFGARVGGVALVIVLSFTESSDPDLGFHLATGRAVLEARSIPSTNVLTFAEPNHPWLDHSALSSVALELAYRAGGFLGTRALQMLLTSATALFVLATAKRLGARPTVAFALCALGMWAAAFRFVERPLLFSDLALAAALWSCSLGLERTRTGQPRPAMMALGGAGLAFAIGTQLHAGAIFIAAILLGIAVALALEPFTAKYKEPLVETNLARRGALVLLASIVGAAIISAALLAIYHPFGIAVLTVPFRIGFDAYLLEHIIEFRAAHALPLRVMAPYWGFVAVSIVIVLASVRRAPLPFLVPILAGLALSLRHGRFADLAWIAATPSLAALASQRLSPRTFAPALAIVLSFGAILDRAAIAPPAIGPAPTVWPMPLFEVLEKTHVRGPGYVQDGWAGPFLAKFWPTERVFFHPVFEAYSAEHAALYQKIRYGEPGWEEAFSKFGIEFVLMKHTSERERTFQQGKPNLRQLLAASSEWALVSFDEYGALWVRRNGTNAELAKEAPSGVDPDRLMFMGRPRGARAGLEAMLDRGPRTVRLAILLGIARADAGDRAGAKEALDAAAQDAPDDPRVEKALKAIQGP